MKWHEKFDRYVGHFTKHQDHSHADDPPDDGVKVLDADIGRKVGFNRVAVHHIVLPAGCRTSRPHAESLEEEFVLVLKGTPHLWLNGYVHVLKEGHAVGFPSGTGIAHTFINNTDHEVHLLVAGEKTKKENLCSFPINPELKETCGIWWSDSPSHHLGPHRGLPGIVQEAEIGDAVPECVLYCPEIPRTRAFHYPGDNETFGNGFRVTDKVGLKALGVWYDYLPSGGRSSFPHAHSHEEEFVYVIKGRPTVWMDGFAKQVGEGDFAAFVPGTGVAHTLINETEEEVVYLCIGETRPFPDEKIAYPLNPLRARECERKGRLWKNAPEGKRGDHGGRAAKGIPDHISLRLCSEKDVDEIARIFARSPGYFLKVDGCPPSEKTARHALLDGPKQTGDKYFKEFLIIEYEGQAIGVLDLHAHHPDPGICYLGLLLLDEKLVGHGLGRKCYLLAEDYIRRAFGCGKIRLGVSDDNEVSGFWRKMGFELNGKTYEWKGEAKTSVVREYDKQVVK